MTNLASSVTPPNAKAGASTIALTLLAFAAYFVGLHALIVGGTMPALTLAVAVAPWIVATYSMLLASGRSNATRGLRVVVAAAVAAAIALVAWRFGDALVRRTGALLYVENVAFLALLSLMFASTLRPAVEPLITRLARAARNGDMPRSVVAYTRRVTIAWALFFAIAAMVSTALYVGGSREAWSMFANLLIWPLVVAMFAVEYAVRLRVLRHVAHGSMLRGVAAFRHRADIRGRPGPSP